MKKLEQIYLEALLKLKEQKRPLIKLDEELVEMLLHSFDNAIIHSNNESDLKKIFCILSHTQNYSLKFLKHFKLICENNFKIKLSNELTIYHLTATEKQIIIPFLKEGINLPDFYISYLKQLLLHQSPEVLEWTLRTISSTGPHSKLFKNEIRSLKPKLHLIFNKHQRWAFEIVDFLEKEWKHLNL